LRAELVNIEIAFDSHRKTRVAITWKVSDLLFKIPCIAERLTPVRYSDGYGFKSGEIYICRFLEATSIRNQIRKIIPNFL
jgi:hypothetical protein